MIDTHAHIDTERFEDDFDEVISRAKEAGVEKVIIPAIEPAAFDRIVQLAEKYDEIYFGIGVHPHSADKYDDEVGAKIYEIASTHPKCVAVGEIGLDYFYDNLPDRRVQQHAFREQIKIAKKVGKPIIVHNRDSDEDLITLLSDEKDDNLDAVLHCFPDSVDLLKNAMDLGFYVSFTGNITFKKSEHKEVLEQVPMDRFMIETDSPYMAPVPNRGKRNEPSFVTEIAKKISEVKNMKYETIVEQTISNTKKFFGIATLLLAMLAMSTTAYSQDEEYYYDDEEYEDSPVEIYEEAPYPKFIGIGGFVGTNTIVESQTFIEDENKDSENISYEGIIAFGGTVTFGGIADYLILQAGYSYSKNTKPVETAGALEPNIHQIIEFSSLWIPNPHNKINVYGILGPSFIMNSINGNENSQLGINTGVGFILNVPLGNIGLLNLAAEWKLNFELTSVERELLKADGEFETIESNNFYSIPRLNLIFYPNF